MDSEVRERLTRLDVIVEHHEKEIASLKATSQETVEWLMRIQKTMDKMLWLATGAAIMYLSNTLGLSQVIAKLFL